MATAAFAQSAVGAAQGALKQRFVPAKPARTTLNPAKVRPDAVVLKFREGTHVRERAGVLEADLSSLTDADERLLQRANLPRQRLFQDLAEVNASLGAASRRFVTRLFSRPEPDLDAEKREGELRSGEELADLNLYYLILIADAKIDETARFIDQLNALASVEIAYAQPISQAAMADIAPTTSSFTGSQGYKFPAATAGSTTNGIDATYAQLFPGGKGDDIQIIDVEQGWNLTHEDMPGIFFQGGSNNGESNWRQHGTAVLGVMVSGENAYGMTGIAPRSRVGVSSEVTRTCFLGICWWTSNFGDAVNRATSVLRAGDVMLIELHAPGPDSGLTAPCNADQFEFIAMEFWDANFDAIKNATAKGVVVVEAAGNGSMDLDSSIYSGKFNRANRDSGAILVGAGSSFGRSPLCFTNFGSRVDLQGWGENVATLGKGDIKINGNDDNQWYTLGFSGTSSATPIVAGAVASLQGFRKARSLGVFSPIAIRDFLRQTGVAQASSSKQIGPLPNLKAAIDAHAPKRTLKVTFLSAKVVDNVFTGPRSMNFNYTVNSSVTQSSGTFTPGVTTALPANLSLTGVEVLDGGLLVQVSSQLPAIITYDPKTGAITSVKSRPVTMIHWFPTGTSFSSNPLTPFGSKTFTDKSTDANGYFEVTYRVEELMVAAP